VVDGCSANGEMVPDNYVDSTYVAGVRCCAKNGSLNNNASCLTPYSCYDKQFYTFDQAVAICAFNGHRIPCTKEQLEADRCCLTGGGCDEYAVWAGGN
jgi:hypothetical protein